jgi:ABC-type uncharacterized transport system permease subunit
MSTLVSTGGPQALWRRVLASVAVASIVLGAIVSVILAGHHDLAQSFGALLRGAFGSPYAFFSATLVRATPLTLLGLAVSLAFRAGVMNIGAEGQFLAGASAASAVALAGTGGGAVLVVAIPAAIIAGALWAAIAGWLKRRFGVLEVISTLMLNFVAQYLVSYLVRGPLQEPTRVYPQTSSFAAAAHLPLLIPGQRLHLGYAMAVVLAATLWWMLRATAVGFRLRAVGAGAAAAASAGRVAVPRVMFTAFLLSGAIAGLAGGVEVTGVTYALYEGISPGFGYTAIAAALLARLNPLAVVGTGLFFGALEAGAAAMQRDAGVPFQFVAVVEALVVLGVMALEWARDRGTESR